MINYFSLYLCRYGIYGKEAVGVALVELKSLRTNMRNQNLYVYGYTIVNNSVQWFKCIMAPYPPVHRLYG